MVDSSKLWPRGKTPEPNGNLLTSAIDSVLRYLRNIRRQPVSIQIASGTAGGLVTGYIFTKTSKMFAAIVGCTLIVLQFFNYRGYLKFNRSQLQQDLDELGDAFKKELGIRRSALPSGREVDDFLSKNAYLFTGFIAGNLVGYSIA